MVRKYFEIAAVALLFLAGLVLGQRVALADVVELTLVQTTTGNNLGGVYTSPYQLEITNTITGASQTSFLICDDFATDTYFGEQWLADTIQFTPTGLVVGGPQKFNVAANHDGTNTVVFPDGTENDYTIQQQYDAVAWLATKLFAGTIGASEGSTFILDPTLANEYSYAIWQIFDSAADSGYNNQDPSAGDANFVKDVTADMTNAFSAGAPSSDYVITVYTPIESNNGRDSFPSQEFIGVSVPEGSTPVLLALDFVVLAGIILLVRRRKRRVA